MASRDELHEQFAHCILKGMTQADAYRHVYPKSRSWKPASVDNKASVLARSPGIQARVARLREPVVQAVREQVAYNLAHAMQEAERALELAERIGNPGAMVAAAQLRAKLNGLLVERKEVSVTQMGNMTPTDKQDLLDMAKAALEERKRQVQLSDQSIDDVIPKS